MDEILASIRRILAEDEHSAIRPAPRPRAASDVLDLTEALNDDGTVRHIAPARPVVSEVPAPGLRSRLLRGLPDGRIEPVPPRPGGAAPRLVSETASEAIAASFARLANVPTPEGNAAQLDELVRETLRPLLQVWLDENLPDLVERLVRAEIARVVGNRPAAP